MKIMMISAEFSPFAKTGGLADAVSSLSISLQKLNNDVCVVLPRYYSIDKSNLTLHKKAMCVAAWNQDVFVDIYKTMFHGVTIYFIDYEKAFGRDGIYGSSYEPDFYDNPYRFSILCRAAFALCHTINWYPDIMHSHDWSSALIPVLLKHYYRNGFFSKTVSVFSIHNMGYQGKYPLSAFPLLSLDPTLKKAAQIEQNNLINLLQAGIFNADYVTTVSPTYAKEIQTSEGGFGL
ncbi:MAG: glycogen/starch synthase, partial [Treponema sp.]|nr:glycogen/starch synthase [Treponema sp.]